MLARFAQWFRNCRKAMGLRISYWLAKGDGI
jgi:hypothetical protein